MQGEDIELPWTGIFSGREGDMAVLKAAWGRVTGTPPEPQVVVLLAESGLGKTRLAQELYTHISTTVDGEGRDGYWPDLLKRHGNHLTLNPLPSDCISTHRMPFLWWGLRAQDPLGRGASLGDAVRSGLSVLRPHLENLTRAAQRLDLDARRDRILGKLAMDTAFEALDATTFGLLGLLHSATESVADYLDIRRVRRGLQGEIDLGSIVDRERVTLVDTILSDLARLVKEPLLGMTTVPAVLLVDDAQFVDSDPTLKELTLRTVRKAVADAWPLLVVVSHWEREWYEACGQRDESLPSQLTSLLGPRWSPHVLGKVDDLGAMVDAGLPGLTAGQRSLLLGKADGNPRLLDEIMRRLYSRPRYFDGRDNSATLTPKGEEEVRKSDFDLYKLIDERFSRTPAEVRSAVSLSSLQGIRFVERVSQLALEGLELSRAKGDEALRRAAKPYSFITRLRPGVAEFTQRVYHEVAMDRLEDLIDPDQARGAVKQGLHRLAGESREFLDLEGDLRQTAWDVGMAILAHAGATPADRRLLAHCYVNAVKAATAEGDVTKAAAHAGDFTGKLAGGILFLEDVTIEEATALLRGAVEGERLEAASALADRMFSDISERSETGPGISDALLWITQARINLYGHAAAEPSLKESLRISRAALAEEDKPGTRTTLFWALTQSGGLEKELRGPAAAEPVYREALACAYALLKSQGSSEAQRLVYVALFNVGSIEEEIRGPAAAEPPYRQSLEAARAYLAGQDTLQARSDVLVSLLRLGDAVKYLQDTAAAMPLFQEALEIARALRAEQDTRATRRSLLTTLASFGKVQPLQAAEPLYREALEIARDLLAGQDAPLDRGHLWWLLANLGDVHLNLHSPRTAEPLYREALEVARGLRASNDSPGARASLLISLESVGVVRQALGEADEARTFFEEALDLALSLARELPSAKTRQHVVRAQVRLKGAQLQPPSSEPGCPYAPDALPSAGFTQGAGRRTDPIRTAAVVSDLAALLGPPPDLPIAATEYDLPFYPGWKLYRLDVPQDEAGNRRHGFLLHMEGLAVPVRSESTLIHAVSQAAPLRLDGPSTAISFLRFFCEFVRGIHGPFLIVSEPQYLPWKETPGDEEATFLLSVLAPPRVTAEPHGDDPSWRLQACVLFGDTLFRSNFVIIPGDGTVTMIDDEVIRANLKVARDVQLRTDEYDLLGGWPESPSPTASPEEAAFVEYCQTFIGYGRLPEDKATGFVPWLHELAEGGEVDAMSLLGQLYKNGRGVDRNVAEAMKWLQAAAEAGDPLAMSSLGFLYANGEGFEVDDGLSEHWLSRAGENGEDEFRGFEKGEKAVWVLLKLNREVGLPWHFPISTLILVHEIVHDPDGEHKTPIDDRDLSLSSGKLCLVWNAGKSRWVPDDDFSRSLIRILRIYEPDPHRKFSGFLQAFMNLLRELSTPRLVDCMIPGILYKKVLRAEELISHLGPDDRRLFENHFHLLLELGLIEND